VLDARDQGDALTHVSRILLRSKVWEEANVATQNEESSADK